MPAHDDLFLANAKALAGFIGPAGREPDATANDPEEARLARWLAQCRRAAGGRRGTFVWTAARKSALDALVPGWDPEGPPARRSPAPGVLSDLLRDDTRFRRNAEDYAQFLSKHGAPPSITSTDSHERLLSRWMFRNRTAARGNGLSALYPERRELLDRMFPGWSDEDVGHRFRLRAEQCAAWQRRHGRLPSHHSPHKPERELGLWLQRTRYSATRAPGSRAWSHARERLLDELLPGWRDVETRDDHFERRAHHYAGFLARYSREPNTAATDRHERSLYQWMAANRRNHSGDGRDRMSTDRHELLDEIIPGWLGLLPAREPDVTGRRAPTRAQQRLAARAELCAAFMVEHRRYPSGEVDDPAEKSLGSWLSSIRRRSARMDAQDCALLDQRVPGWRCADVKHRRRAERCATFRDEYGEWPRPLGNRPQERELSAFLHECRLAERGVGDRAWSDGHACYLDALVPGWRDRPAPLGRALRSRPPVGRRKRVVGAVRYVARDMTIEDDAFCERLAAMTSEQVCAYYNATAEDWAAIGIDVSTFTGNMKVRADYEKVVRPFELVLDAYLAMSDQPGLRQAKIAYTESLEDLRGPAHRHRRLAEVDAEAQTLRRAYDDIIATCGDQRVIDAKRNYDHAVAVESEKFARRLR